MPLRIHHQLDATPTSTAALEAEAATANNERGGRTPSRFSTAGGYTLAIVCSHNESPLDHGGHHRHALCGTQNVLGNPLIGCGHDFIHHRCCGLYPFNFVRAVSSCLGNSQQHKNAQDY